MTPEQLNRIVELAHRIAIYNRNIQVAERRHEYNQAAYLRDEMVAAIGHLKAYISAQLSASRHADNSTCARLP